MKRKRPISGIRNYGRTVVDTTLWVVSLVAVIVIGCFFDARLVGVFATVMPDPYRQTSRPVA
jgi:hypothetical protein